MVVKKRKNKRASRKIGRKSAVTRRNAVRTPRASRHSADALDGAIIIASAMTKKLGDMTHEGSIRDFAAATFGGAVTGVMMQGETVPKEIVRLAMEIVNAALENLQEVKLQSRSSVVDADVITQDGNGIDLARLVKVPESDAASVGAGAAIDATDRG
jgi:hypothetical protein